MSAKHALITGGAGFIGSHLCEFLLKNGWTVTALDDLSTGSRSNLSALNGNASFRFVNGCAENEALVLELVKEADAVYHLAAVVGVKKVMENTVGTINKNLSTTHTVLDACAAFGRRTIITSTSEVYGANSKDSFNEDDDSIIGSSRHRRWCYAATKLLDEFYAYAHYHSSGLPVTIVRLFNTIGPRQVGHYGMVVPNFVARALRNEPLIVHGDGKQSRCFTSVDDVVRCLYSLSENHSAASGQTFNIGSRNEISIMELARKVIELTESKSEIICKSYEEIYGEDFVDLQRRIPDTSRLKEAINFVPEKQLTDMLDDIVNWQKTLL